MEEKVVIKVTSDEGHTEFTLIKKEAVSKLTELYDGGQRWIYLNGSVVSPSRLSESMLTPDTEIKVANALVGGYCYEDPEADFDLHIAKFNNGDGEWDIKAISPKSKFPMVIEIIPANAEEIRTAPAVRVWVDEDSVVEVLHMRSLLCKGIEHVLDEFVEGEADKYATIYNVK